MLKFFFFLSTFVCLLKSIIITVMYRPAFPHLACNSVTSTFFLTSHSLKQTKKECTDKQKCFCLTRTKKNVLLFIYLLLLPLNVRSFWGVKHCLVVLVVAHSFPVRLLSPRVLVPQIATANSFTNKGSRVWFCILDQASLCTRMPPPKWIWQN